MIARRPLADSGEFAIFDARVKVYAAEAHHNGVRRTVGASLAVVIGASLSAELYPVEITFWRELASR